MWKLLCCVQSALKAVCNRLDTSAAHVAYFHNPAFLHIAHQRIAAGLQNFRIDLLLHAAAAPSSCIFDKIKSSRVEKSKQRRDFGRGVHFS
jgi:hypothetical protein